MPPFNPVANPTLATEEAAIKECLKDVQSLSWQMGFHYRRVIDGELWKEGPYKKGADWGSKVFKKGVSSLANAAAVCRAFEQEVAAKYDFTCLVRFLVWAHAAKLPSVPKDPGDTLLSVPGRKGKTEKKFSECTVQEINNAISALTKKKSDELPAEDAERYSRFRAALAELFTEDEPIRLKVTAKGKKGGTTYTFGPVPFELFAKGIDALSRARAPVPKQAPAVVEAAKANARQVVENLTAQLDTPAKVAAFEQNLREGLRTLQGQLPAAPPPQG